MEPTKLELIQGFDQTKSGYTFAPEDSDIRAIVTGKDWSNKKALIYGCTSDTQAKSITDEIIDRINQVGHFAQLADGPEIRNIAVNGDLGSAVVLEELVSELNDSKVDVEYEPEQFPALIVKLHQLSATFTVFSTGKFVIQGLRSLDEIEPAIDTLVSTI